MRFIFALLCLFSPSVAFAGLGSYLANYRVGVELQSASESSEMTYEAGRNPTLPSSCETMTTQPTRMKCRMHIGEGNDWTWGLSVQQVFKRTGWLYGNYDLGLSIFNLDGQSQVWDPAENDSPPIHNARLHLYGLNVKGYIEFGITPPKIIPDLIFSYGLGRHLSTGNLKINGDRYRVSVSANVIFFQMELVWWRFKDGFLSSYVSSEGSTQDQSLKININNMSNFALRPSTYSVGLVKLVLPFSTK